jgi:hypothetical protein
MFWPPDWRLGCLLDGGMGFLLAGRSCGGVRFRHDLKMEGKIKGKRMTTSYLWVQRLYASVDQLPKSVVDQAKRALVCLVIVFCPYKSDPCTPLTGAAESDQEMICNLSSVSEFRELNWHNKNSTIA